MLATSGQGDLVAARDAVAVDEDFRLQPRNEPVEISWANLCHCREEVAAVFKEILGEVVSFK